MIHNNSLFMVHKKVDKMAEFRMHHGSTPGSREEGNSLQGDTQITPNFFCLMRKGDEVESFGRRNDQHFAELCKDKILKRC